MKKEQQKKNYETPEIKSMSERDFLKVLGPARADIYGEGGGLDL